eukprot:2634378-Ditylum_brightwellii.AAC.1
MEEPNNIIECCTPIVPKEEAGYVLQKYNHDIAFNREAFKGTFDAQLKNRNGTYKRDSTKQIRTTDASKKGAVTLQIHLEA